LYSANCLEKSGYTKVLPAPIRVLSFSQPPVLFVSGLLQDNKELPVNANALNKEILKNDFIEFMFF